MVFTRQDESIPASRVFIVDAAGTRFPCEYVAPWALVFRRGFTPYVVEVAFTLPALSGVKNPISFEFECADERASPTPHKRTVKGWHVVEERSAGENTIYRIADPRWPAQYKAINAQYNIVSYGGEYRPASLRSGKPWTAYDAAKDALEQLGLVVEETEDKSGLKAALCPPNLMNTEGGRFHAGKMAEVLPAVFEAMRADLVPTYDGGVEIVARSGNESQNLENYGVDIDGGGSLAPRQNRWQRPPAVIVQFPVKVESYFEFGTEERTAVRGQPQRPEIENVMPSLGFDVTDIDADENPVAALDSVGQTLTPRSDAGFVELYSYALEQAGLEDFHILERWLAPSLFPENRDKDPNDTAGARLKRKAIEGLVRGAWRRMWRVKADSATALRIRSTLASITFGRLQADGTVKANPVECDWVKILRLGVLPRPSAHTSDAVFSRQYSFTQAPFTAEWLEPESLVFSIKNGEFPLDAADVLLGKLERPIKPYPDFGAMKAGKSAPSKAAGIMAEDFRLRVYYAALVVAQSGGASPRYETETALFHEGGQADGPRLVLGVDDITANYDSAGALLNGPELKARAAFIARQVETSYRGSRAGTLTCNGLDPIVRGKKRVSGDIYEIAISVGRRQLWDIDTVVTVQPEIRRSMLIPEEQAKPEAVL